jgi:hypothetical protein
MIAIASWPFLLKLQGWLWGKRWLAVLPLLALQLGLQRFLNEASHSNPGQTT